MKRNIVPCCFFPTTSVFTDDNPTFLEHLPLELDPNKARFSTYFNIPTDALEFINKTSNLASLLSDEVFHSKGDSFESSENTIEQIHHLLFNAQRFETVSIVVADQVMPQMNGLDLCSLIENQFIRKIILTGEADEKFAISAFNEDLINYFIRKDRADFGAELNHALANLQHELFEEVSLPLINTLVASGHPCPFTEPEFVKFFQQVYQAHNIEEYYALDASGSFLMIDSQQKLKWLIVKTDDELDHFAEFIEDEGAPKSISQPLRNRDRLIYFYNRQDSLKLPSEWESFTYPVQGKIIGKYNYNYALLDDVVASGFDKSKIKFSTESAFK